MRVVLSLAASFLFFPPAAGAAETYMFAASRVEPAGPAADFTLIGPDGKPYSLTSLRGKFVLLAFGFTHCPNTCPTTLANLGAACEKLSAAERKRVQVLFITIDPARDTPAVLKAYVPFFDPNFIGLSGTPDQIESVTRAFGIEYEKSRDWGGGDESYTLDHTAGAMLLAPSGQWIGSYGSNRLVEAQRIADDLRHFLALPDAGGADWQSEHRGLIKAPRLSGREIYQQECATCHGAHGEGVAGKYPALANSSWVNGPPIRLTALVLDGVRGTKESASSTHGVMPAWWRILTPASIADVLTYIRQSWGNNAPPISAPYVRKLGYRFAVRPGFWSWSDLKALPADKDSDVTGL